MLSTWWSNESLIKRHRSNLAPGAFGPPRVLTMLEHHPKQGGNTYTRNGNHHPNAHWRPLLDVQTNLAVIQYFLRTGLFHHWFLMLSFIVSTCSNWNKETHPMTVKHAGDFVLPHCPGGTQLPKQPIIQSLCPITAGFNTRRGFFWLLDFEQFNCN